MNQDKPASNDADDKSQADESRKVSFRELGQGSREVIIEHEGQVYRLRETRNGKLILNK